MKNSNSQNENQRESWLYSLLPIHSFELKKFLPMAIIMGLILFNYSSMRVLKDSLILNAYPNPKDGANLFPFLKFFWVLPSAMIAAVLYSKVRNAFSSKAVFIILFSPFLVFFALFPIVIYPNADLLHNLNIADGIDSTFMRGIMKTFGIWGYSLFYTITELISSVLLSFAFWNFANQITPTAEAKRFYPTFVLVANLFVSASGAINAWIASMKDDVLTINASCGIIVIGIILIISIYLWMYNNVLTDKRFYDPDELKKSVKKQKVKVSLLDSFKIIFSSKYLGLVAVLVLSYGITINLIDGPWKQLVKELYPSISESSGFFNRLQMVTGFMTVVASLSGAATLRRYGWLAAAIATPLVMFIFGLFFYSFLLFNDKVSVILSFMVLDPLFLAVLCGSVVVLASRTFKYGFFDPTKEMAYIPLPDELRSKGKAVVDIVGGRLGKSGGAMLQIFLFFLVGQEVMSLITPYLGMVFIVLCVGWILAVISLNKSYTKLVAQKEKNN